MAVLQIPSTLTRLSCTRLGILSRGVPVLGLVPAVLVVAPLIPVVALVGANEGPLMLSRIYTTPNAPVAFPVAVKALPLPP